MDRMDGMLGGGWWVVESEFGVVYEPPASRFAGTPFNSPSGKGREMFWLRKRGRFVFVRVYMSAPTRCFVRGCCRAFAGKVRQLGSSVP